MCAADRSDAPANPIERDPHGTEYGTIVVVGGGCYGSYYVRQLGRALAAGAIRCTRVLVVDRDARCAVARAVTEGAMAAPPRVELVVDDWRAFFARYLAAASDDPAAHARDAIVPSPLMPHLMYEWVLERARARWPRRTVETRPLDRAPAVPWSRGAPDGTHYVSFAEWECPINCIEPARCPHTRGPRSWSLPRAAADYVEEERRAGRALAGPLVFHCRHRAFGVGMFDVREVVAADAAVRAAGEAGEAAVLVGTMSHCHGALNRLVIGPGQADAGSGGFRDQRD